MEILSKLCGSLLRSAGEAAQGGSRVVELERLGHFLRDRVVVLQKAQGGCHSVLWGWEEDEETTDERSSV